MAALVDFCNARKIISVHCFSLETLDPAATVHCRDFSPAVGVPEESATGTASGATGCYLVLNRLVKVEEPVTRIICEQGNILKRPSIIYVEVGSAAGQITSVRVGGSAVTAIEGKIRIPEWN
jgi:trans-2,3-dihydro-3-hydroxyanthranilate isomerase